MDRSQHLVKVPYSVEIQDSIKGPESDKTPVDEAQYSVCAEDSNKIEYSIQGQNAISKNIRCLLLITSPNLVAKRMPHLKIVKPKGRKQITSSKLNRHSAYGLVPLSLAIKRQKNRRKILRSKSKFNLKVSSQKSKKTPASWVFQITICPVCASKRSKLGCKYNTKKKELHQGKSLSDKALHIIYVSKFVFPYIKYSRRKLVKVLPGLTGCRHFLPKQNKLLAAEKVSYAGAAEKRGSLGNTEHVKQHGRDHKGLKHLSPKTSPQVQRSFMVDTYQLKSPYSLLIEINWKNKESFKDPTTQAKETGTAQFYAPNCKKTTDLNIPKPETPLEEAISEHLQKFVFSPNMELNRGMKTLEGLKSTENAHLPLSNEEELPPSTLEMQGGFLEGNIQKQKDILEVVLEFSDVSSLISLGTKKHKGSEQLAGVKIQESTGDRILKDKRPIIVTVTAYDSLSESEELECDIRVKIKNMQDKIISDALHNATDTTISEPPDTEMHRGLKAKPDTIEIMGFSHSATKQGKLSNEKKISNAKYSEKRCIFKKPQEHDRGEEEQVLQEEVTQLAQDFRVSLQLKQEPKYVKFETGQSTSGSRKTQNKEQAVQPPTPSTQRISGPSPCPTMDPFQVKKVKQSTDRPTVRETADLKSPLTEAENSAAGEVFTETPECGVPFGESPGKTLGDHIAEEREYLKRVLPEVVLRSFMIHMLPLLYFKRQKIIKKLPGTKSTLDPRCINMKVKKPAISLVPYNRYGIPGRRKRLRGNVKILTQQMLLNKIVADVLLNVICHQPHIRTHSRLNTENQDNTKLKQEKSQAGKEEKCSDSISKESDSGNIPEVSKLQDEVRGNKEAPPKAVLCGSCTIRLDARPEEELKTLEEMHQPITSAGTIMQSICSFRLDPFHENMKKSITTQTDLKGTADSEVLSSTSEKSLIGEPLNQTRGSSVPDQGSDTREMRCCFAETKAELPEGLPAAFPETSNCHMPILTHSKLKRKSVRFSPIECTMKPKSEHVRAMKPSISELSNTTGHQEKLECNFKNKFEKIDQANGMVYEFLNNLYSPMYSRLQVKRNSFCHAQLKQQKLTDEERPWYVDFFDKSNAFCNREEKVQNGGEVEQRTSLEAAPQRTHYWDDACQGMETHPDTPDPKLGCLTQELQHQTCFKQTALQIGLQMGPREAEELQETNQTENDRAPLSLKILPPKAGNSPLDKCLNTTTECGLPSSRNSKKQLDSYFMENNSELQKHLQVISLKSSDSVEFVSKSKRKKNTSKIARKQIIRSCRYRAMRGKNPSVSHMLNDRQSKELRHNLKTKMKNSQQKKNVVDASLDIIYSKLPILPNIKMDSIINVETDMQRILRLGHMQLMQEQSPNGQKVCCPDSIDVSSLSSCVKDEKEKEGEHRFLPASKNSQCFIYQKENHELVKTDEELKQPQIDFTQTVLDSASCPIYDQFQFRKPERCSRFSPPKSGEAKIDEIFSARKCAVPLDANHQNELIDGIEKKETVTFDCSTSAFTTSKRKKNIKQYSDTKMLVNPKSRILKAKKPSISYILNIKGSASPNHRRKLGCNLTTKMKKVDEGEKMADKMYSFMTITPDINMHSKIEREKDMLGEKQLSSKQVKQAISLHEGDITSDDTEPTNSRQFESNFNVTMEESIPVADIMLNVISSAMPLSLDINVNNRIKSETDMPGEMRFSHELQQQEQSPDGKRACVHFSDKRGSAASSMKKAKVQGGEAAPWTTQHFSFNAHKTKEPHFVSSDLELKISARTKIPKSLSTTQELQRRTLVTQHVLRSISHSILNLLSLEELSKRTKPQKGLKDTRNPKISSPMAGKSINESSIVTAQSSIPFEKCPRKGLASSIAEGKIPLQKDLPVRIIEFFYSSMPGSSDFKRQRNAAQIPKSITGKAQMVLKTINITRFGAFSHGKQQDPILETMVKEISLRMSNMFINTSLSSTPVSPAINIHKKEKAKKGSLRKKINITRCWEQSEGKQDEGRRLCTYSCNKWSTSSNTFESGWQDENNEEDNEILFEAGLPFLNSMRSRTDQNMLIVEQEAQQQTRVSENISESFCPTLMIPFRTEKLKKTIPPQEDMLHTRGEKISCSKLGKAMFDDFLVDEMEYSSTSDGSHTRKLDVHNAVFLQPKEKKEDIKVQKVIKYTTDQNIPPTNSGDSLLGDPCDGRSRRNVGGQIAKKCEELQRDLLTMSTMSILSESKRQEKVFNFPERRNLTGPMSVTLKAKKTKVSSQMLTITEHGDLYCRKEQECNLYSTKKDLQQNKSIANTFSSPIPFSTEKKIDIEMYSTLKAETVQQRVKLHNPTYLQLEESLCYREAQKANFTDTQNRSNCTMKMNVQQNKEEVGVKTINLMFPKRQEKKIQGRRDEPGVLLARSSISLPSLPLLKLDKEIQRITNAVGIVHTGPISGEIMKDVQNKKPYLPQKEERDAEKTVPMSVMIHTADTSLKSKKSAFSYMPHRTELHVNIERQGENKHEGQGKPPGTVLRKVYVSKPPTNLKLDKDTQVDEEELGIKRPPLFSEMVSALSDTEKTEDTETIGDVRKRIQDLLQKEKDREQNKVKDLLEMKGFSLLQLQPPESSGAGNLKHAGSKRISSCITIIKANQHGPYKDSKERVKIEGGKGRILPKIRTLRVETSPLTQLFSTKRLPLNIKDQVKDVQKDKGKPETVQRRACAPLPSAAHLNRGTKTNEKEDTLGTTQSSFPPLKIQYSSNSGEKTFTKSVEGYTLEEKDRLKISTEDKMLPIYMDLKAKKLPLPHILNTKELLCKIKEQKRKVEEDKKKLVTNIKSVCISLLTLPDLKFVTTEREEGRKITTTEVPFPQLQSKVSSDAAEIEHAELIDGELSNDVKEYMLQKKEKNGEKCVDVNIIVDPNCMYLNAKKLPIGLPSAAQVLKNKAPILLIYNLSGLQRKTKEPKGKVQMVTCEPAGVMLSRTWTSGSSSLYINMSVSMKENSMLTLTRSSVPLVIFQESSDSKEGVYVETILPDILGSPQEGKQCMPQNKEEAGVEMTNLMLPTHQEKKMPGSNEYDFNRPKKIALQNADNSEIFTGSLSISLMSPSQTEETVESETNLDREERICLSKFQKKPPNATDIVKRNNLSIVEKRGQNFTNAAPEDSQPFMVDQQQMQELSSVISEENYGTEINKKNLTPQTEERVVLGHGISRITKEPDLITIKQEEKAPEPIVTPTECPCMSEDPKENVETHLKSTLSINISSPGVEEPQHETQPIDTIVFLSLEGIDTIKINLNHEHQNDSPPMGCMKTLTVNVSTGSKELITKLKSISELENGTSPVTSANKMPLSQILQNYSVEEKDKLLMHFSVKTLEVQMKAFPRTVRESYAMADTQDRRKPLSKCIHSGVKVPKEENRILLFFEEKSLHQIELDLQYKYLRFLQGLSVESMFPKPNILPEHNRKLNSVAMCKKVDNSGESGSLSIERDLLEQHISLKKQSPHKNSSLIRRFLEPTHVCASDPELHRTAQKDTTVLSVLRSHVTTGKKKHHVWFQETDTHESFDFKTKEHAPGLVDYHSIQTSQDFPECQTDIQSSANLEERSALKVHESEESMFLEDNPYLNQESESILLKLQKGIPLEKVYKMKQIKTDLKPFHSDKSGSHHIRCRKPSTVTPPSCESCKSRKYRSSSKIQSPDCVCHNSLNTVEVPFVSSSVPFSEEKLSCTTKNRTSYSLAPLTESNIKLHLAKTQDIPHRHPESKERKKAKHDLFTKNFVWDCDPSYTQCKKKCRRKKALCDYESEKADFPSKHKSASKLHQEDISFHSERKQNQPFFYACVPADSVESIPQTICWTIPQTSLRRQNIRVPIVAKISSSFNM